MTSGRAAWYSADESTTAGRRFTPATPGKSTTTTSPALGKFLIFGVKRGCIVQREGH